MTEDYYPRLADKLLQERLQSAGAVLIEGPKWCGKTSTAERQAKSILYMQDPDQRIQNQHAAEVQPSLLLQGDTPRLLDEWQEAPVLWDAVRHSVDRRGGAAGQYILTGSAVPADDHIRHSGTGRFARLLMRPMSLFESEDSSGSISLRQLFDRQTEVGTISQLSLEQLAYVTARGGWPASIKKSEKDALQQVINYVDLVVRADVARVDTVRRSPERVRALLRSLARNVGTMASISTIRNDLSRSEGGTEISDKTITQYMRVLQRIFVTEDMPAWNPVLRSRTAIRTSPKRYFVDPSVPVAVFALTPDRLLQNLEYFGFLFESLCVRDLRIYAQAIDGEVYHYRDKNDLEADAVVVLKDGRWGAVEIKLGSRDIEEGAKHLLKLQEKIDTERMPGPSFLMVLTGGQYGYTRQDGVHIVPIGTLRD